MTRSLTDRLFATAAPSVAKLATVTESVPDLQRILALPRRPPYVCKRDPVTGRYPIATQALVEVETAKFSRGQRISCACRPRIVRYDHKGMLTVFRILPEDMPPEPPIYVSREAFLADNRTMGDAENARKVAAMQPGDELSLPSATGDEGHPCIVELSPPQAWFLREGAQVGGAVGFLGVGSGKSIAFLLAPLLFPDSRLAVLLIEPKQRHHYKKEYLRLREHFRVSSIVSDVEIPGSTVPGTTPVHLISYSVLSRTENSDKLDRLEPDLLLLDEGHRACGQSAINLRVKRYAASCIKKRETAILEGKPVRARALRLMTGSGTLEVKSVNDTQMLCTFALGTWSPLPIDPREAVLWSGVMDLQYQPDRKSSTARALHRAFGDGRALLDSDECEIDIVETAEDSVRKGFQKWRSETPGIITAVSDEVKAAHYISEFEVPPTPQIVMDALYDIRTLWKRPDGEEFNEKVEQISCARNIACGFYTYWRFPKHPCSCPPDRTDTRSANWCEQCILIDDWYLARKKYAKESRTQILKGVVQLDSPALCEEAAIRARENKVELTTGSKKVDRAIGADVYCDTCWHKKGEEVHWPCVESHHKPAWQSEHWAAWSDIEDKVEYEKAVKWIGHDTPEANDPETHPGYFLARAVAEWALKNKAVIWFDSVPLGRKISELSGLPYFNGGPGGEERLMAEKGKRSIIVSISAHGASTDGLQCHFDTQVVVEVPPSNATTHGLEQLFGRLLRRGQRKDAVNTLLCLHANEFRDALRKAIQQAEKFNFMMTGNPQKLLMADIDIDEL